MRDRNAANWPGSITDFAGSTAVEKLFNNEA